mmetsp:Transcript_9973/g.29452  ORF Transcript_9973/g.29452 Transcript_9973/m.29452 type:complete len:237 (+) Transcript_9973:406-1116(+)
MQRVHGLPVHRQLRLERARLLIALAEHGHGLHELRVQRRRHGHGHAGGHATRLRRRGSTFIVRLARAKSQTSVPRRGPRRSRARPDPGHAARRGRRGPAPSGGGPALPQGEAPGPWSSTSGCVLALEQLGREGRVLGNARGRGEARRLARVPQLPLGGCELVRRLVAQRALLLQLRVADGQLGGERLQTLPHAAAARTAQASSGGSQRGARSVALSPCSRPRGEQGCRGQPLRASQ